MSVAAPKIEESPEVTEARKVLTEAQRKYGKDRVCAFMSKPGPVVVRTPPKDVYKTFAGDAFHDDAEQAYDAREGIACASLLYPAGDVFTGWCDDYPGIVNKVAVAALGMADGQIAHEHEKLLPA